jgi:hypothetical protein
MCEYSLRHTASRAAKAGDRLISTRFSGSTTRGFAAIDDPNVAVCLRPGTEIAFSANVEYEFASAYLPRRKVREQVARFRQVDVDDPEAHHDALEFPDGRIALVARLVPGQVATVLQLPVDETVRRKTNPLAVAAPARPRERAPAMP